MPTKLGCPGAVKILPSRHLRLLKSLLRKCLGSKEHPDWLKIDFNVAKIITVQNYKCHKKLMWMDIYICTANSQVGNIMATQKGQNCKILSQGSQKLNHFVGKFRRGPWSRRKHCWDYVSVFKNTSEKLILKSIFPIKVTTTCCSGVDKFNICIHWFLCT